MVVKIVLPNRHAHLNLDWKLYWWSGPEPYCLCSPILLIY